MVFLRKVSVRCKIFVGKIFSQHIKNCKYLCCEICYENEKNIEQNIIKVTQILGNLTSTFKLNLVQKFSITKGICCTVSLNSFTWKINLDS